MAMHVQRHRQRLCALAPPPSRRRPRPAPLSRLRLCLAVAPSLLSLRPGALALSARAAAPASAPAPAPRRRVATRVVAVPEDAWRRAAADHAARVRALLAPGLTAPDAPSNSGGRRRRRGEGRGPAAEGTGWTGLDREHPVYNFLIEYYGLKGAKGPRRLARWSPDPALLLLDDAEVERLGFACQGAAIETAGGDVGPAGGVLLEGANAEDVGSTLHLKGGVMTLDGGGILYSPALFHDRYPCEEEEDAPALASDARARRRKAAAPFQWYRSILASTRASEPVFHCHGLHEWAMQYHPPGADPPPSGKYQSHLPLRVSQDTINEAVERKGIHCTHVDALRFFAPAAGPLNRHGALLDRTDQLRLEQRGCVHAAMDLLKMSLRLAPFVDAGLVAEALDVALRARTLDVEASPYDVQTTYGLGTVPVETEEGREEYRRRQREVMGAAEPARARLQDAYDAFLGLAFDEDILAGARAAPAPERFAQAEPGGKPWRKNLIESETSMEIN